MNEHESPSGETAAEHGDDASPRSLRVDFIKSGQFRVVHADGAWGGVTPQLNIQMAIYSERRAIPRRIVMDVLPTGVAERESAREMRCDLVREVEVDIVMDLNVANAVHRWLGDHIEKLNEILAQLASAAERDQ